MGTAQMNWEKQAVDAKERYCIGIVHLTSIKNKSVARHQLGAAYIYRSLEANDSPTYAV
ncbi:hypothetical protein GGC63_002272 [Paenibacillus sp. OAS669]|nr:hypothetical protein [Paenibacillus sp. OAS669]